MQLSELCRVHVAPELIIAASWFVDVGHADLINGAEQEWDKWLEVNKAQSIWWKRGFTSPRHTAQTAKNRDELGWGWLYGTAAFP